MPIMISDSERQNVTWCEDCDHVHPATRNKEEYYWLCLKFPRPKGHGFVSRTVWTGEHYNRCANINMGFCPVFAPRRVPPNAVKPAEDAADRGGP